MTPTHFNLIFEGRVEPGHDPDVVRHTLEKLFQFDKRQQQNLFSGEVFRLGEQLDQATAESFQAALAQSGAATRLEDAALDSAVESSPDNRKSRRRALANRRIRIRAGAIVPDRRQGKDRRG